MPRKQAYATLLILLASTTAQANPKIQKRCGWWDNPTPQNIWLEDKAGQWLISEQGSYQAKGDWSPNGEKEFTNAQYGRSCVCVQVEADESSKKILRVVSGKTLKLSTCYQDKNLPGYKPSTETALKPYFGTWKVMNEDCAPGRTYTISDGKISMQGEGAYSMKLVPTKTKELWVELENPSDPTDHFIRITKLSAKKIKLEGSSQISSDSLNGMECDLERQK